MSRPGGSARPTCRDPYGASGLAVFARAHGSGRAWGALNVRCEPRGGASHPACPLRWLPPRSQHRSCGRHPTRDRHGIQGCVGCVCSLRRGRSALRLPGLPVGPVLGRQPSCLHACVYSVLCKDASLGVVSATRVADSHPHPPPRHAEYGLSGSIGPLSVGTLISGGDDYSLLKDSGSPVARWAARACDAGEPCAAGAHSAHAHFCPTARPHAAPCR